MSRLQKLELFRVCTCMFLSVTYKNSTVGSRINLIEHIYTNIPDCLFVDQ